jgi:hypothetical protein
MFKPETHTRLYTRTHRHDSDRHLPSHQPCSKGALWSYHKLSSLLHCRGVWNGAHLLLTLINHALPCAYSNTALFLSTIAWLGYIPISTCVWICVFCIKILHYHACALCVHVVMCVYVCMLLCVFTCACCYVCELHQTVRITARANNKKACSWFWNAVSYK